MTTPEMLAAFDEFNDAAYAMGHCQLSSASAAAERLEKARQTFKQLFMKASRIALEPLATVPEER